MITSRHIALALAALMAAFAAAASPADDLFAQAATAYEGGDYAKALPAYQSFVNDYALDERADVAAFRVAQCFGQLKREAEAADAFGSMAKAFPTSRYADGALFNKGYYYYTAEQWQPAAAAYFDYTKVGAKPDLRAKAWFWRAEALSRLDRQADAASAYDSFLAQPNAVLEAGEVKDLTPYGWLGLGLSRARSQEWEKAREALRTYLKNYPSGAAADEATYWLAESDYQLKAGPEAVKGWQSVVDDYPKSNYAPQALLRIAAVQGELGNVAAAQAATNRLAKDYPDHTKAAGAERFNLARRQLLAKDWAGAEKLYREALVGAEPDQKPIGQLGLAEAQFGAEKWPEAAATYRALLTESPQFADAPTARARLAEALLRHGDLAGSEKVGREYLATSPTGPDAAVVRYNLALAVWRQGQGDEAMKLFEQVVKSDPQAAGSAPILLEMGRFGLETKRYEDARSAYELYLKHHGTKPGASEARYGLGQAAEGAGDRAAAIAAYKALADQGGTEPLVADGLARLVDLYRTGGDSARADAAATELRKRFPESAQSAHSLLSQGYEAFKANQYPEAIRLFEAYLRDYPKDEGRPTALANLAAAYYLAGAPDDHFAKAAAAYQRLATDYPDDPAAADSLFWVGQSWQQAGDAEQAIAGYQQFLKLRPDHANAPGARAALVKLLGDSKRGDEAIAVRRAAVEAAVGQEQRAQARYDLAWALLDAGRADEAVTEFEAVAQEAKGTPLGADAEFRLGEQLTERGRYPDAIKAYDAWLAAHSDHALRWRAVYNSAWAKEQAGDFVAAAKGYQEVAQQGDDDLKDLTSYRHAFALWRAGELDEALAAFDHYEQRFPEGQSTADSVFYRGQVYSKQAAWPKAEAAFASLLADHPESPLAPSARYNLGVALQNQAKYLAAADAYEPLTGGQNLAGAEAKLAAQASLQRGQCLLMAGRYDGATAALEAAARASDAEVVAGGLYYLGRTWQQRNDAAKAKTYYQQVVNEHPGTAFADRAKKALGDLN